MCYTINVYLMYYIINEDVMCYTSKATERERVSVLVFNKEILTYF